jgi:adenylate kinase family enzyme
MSTSELETTSAVLSDQERKQLLEENNHEYFKSKFKFIQETRGLRPGMVHMILGTPGSGKSTLSRSILAELLPQVDTCILCWLSEESVEEFKISASKNAVIGDLSKFQIFSEQDIKPETFEKLSDAKKFFEDTVRRLNPRIVFFDNITTSMLYMDHPARTQAATAKWMKAFAKEIGVPFFVVAHTKKDISDNTGKIIDGNDIRGSASIINLTPYLYIFQRFKIEEHFYPTVRIEKHSLHQIEKSMFFLEYSKERNAYTSDRPVTFNEFKEAYNRMNKLGKN